MTKSLRMMLLQPHYKGVSWDVLHIHEYQAISTHQLPLSINPVSYPPLSNTPNFIPIMLLAWIHST